MSLLALRPDFVSRHWEEIRDTISVALPPTGLTEGINLNKLLERILSGGMTCWCVIGKDKIVQGFVVTQISVDYATDTRNLLVYCVSGNFTGDVWSESFETLCTFAKAKDCKRIASFTPNKASLYMAAQLGFNVETRYVYKDI
jgi:hypothetical protein